VGAAVQLAARIGGPLGNAVADAGRAAFVGAMGSTLLVAAAVALAGSLLALEAVATGAGVGKATIYRRWSSKAELVIDAIATLKVASEPVDTGSVRGDLLAIGRQALLTLGQPEQARLIARMMGETSKHPELHEVYRRKPVAPRRRLIATVLQRGIDRGEIRADLDMELLVDMVVGPLIYRVLISGGEPTFAPDHLERLADGLLEGITRR
jgi:AcrR family transcriptional regulator